MEEEKEYKKYEISFYVRDEKDAEVVFSCLEKNNALNVEAEPLKKIQLAYPIKKEKIAFMGTIFFDLEPQYVDSIRNDMRLNSKILRFMIIKSRNVIKEEGKKIKNKENKSSAERNVQDKSNFPYEIPGILTNETLEKKIEEILN